jgi:hypothetical protein
MNYFTPYIHVFNQQKEVQRQQERLRHRDKTKIQPHVELNRLLSAAVVNQRFCQLLLSNPEEALALGCNGERFALSAEEKAQVLAIQADSLQSFASQLLDLQKNEQAAAIDASEKCRRESLGARTKGTKETQEQTLYHLLAFP